MKSAARLFKALSEETRLRLLSLLQEGELCVCDLMRILDLPQSTVSRHLATLRHAGLVEDRRQGVWMYYRLAGGDDPLRREVLALVERHLLLLPEAAGDRTALRQDRTGEKFRGCG